jgi:hypothetical protein
MFLGRQAEADGPNLKAAWRSWLCGASFRRFGGRRTATRFSTWRTPFFRGRKRLQVVRALERRIDRHGGGNYAVYTLKLTFAAAVAKPQRPIFGKRCGTKQNIGPAARKELRQQQDNRKFPTPVLIAEVEAGEN